MSWSHFSHEADIGLRASGSDKESVFSEMGFALTAVITEPENVAALETVEIHCEAPTDELLLVDWLNALVFEMATRRMLFAKFDVELGDGKLDATVTGEHVDIDRHCPAVEVKGATYTSLSLAATAEGYEGRCVVDV